MELHDPLDQLTEDEREFVAHAPSAFLDFDAIDLLGKAYAANPYWFGAVLEMAAIMIPRRYKYGGDNHPYFNFVDSARQLSCHPTEVMRHLKQTKVSRQKASPDQDFGDERFRDSKRDEANYDVLELGYLIYDIDENDVIPPEYNWVAEHWPVLQLDLDGFLNKYPGWKASGGKLQQWPPADDLEEFLRVLHEEYGCYLVIGTARPDSDLPNVQAWFEELGLMKYIGLVTNKKVPSIRYPDDKGCLYNGEPLLEFIPKIFDHVPWWHEGEDEDPEGPIDR